MDHLKSEAYKINITMNNKVFKSIEIKKTKN